MKNNSQFLIYQSPDGNIRVDVRLKDETVWLTQAHMADLFGKSKPTINEHIKNIFAEGELDEKVVIRKFRTTTRHGAIEGKTQSKEVMFYNLDVIISVGYRVKSQQGTQFRIWAVRDEPLILQVKSSISAWTNYSSNGSEDYPAGVVRGALTDGLFGFVGYNSFEHIGPICVPRFKGMTVSNSQLNFSIENMVGSTCHVERATSLIEPDWQPFASFEVVGNSTDFLHAVPSNTSNRAFFRLLFEE